ncbi:MAG: hypothetical protein WC592_05665 [Candidatus Omnitrophota bacterium]|nr:hypothetical protein [Candidatus Omnitrophota bacterium]
MRGVMVLAVVSIAFICPAIIFAENDMQGNGSTPDVSIPPGMEARKVNNDVTILMPKGAKMHQRNATTFILESAEEFSSRKFVEVDRRLQKLEAENVELKKEIDELKTRVNEAREPADETNATEVY